MGVEDLNSRPHTYMASKLLTELPLDPLVLFSQAWRTSGQARRVHGDFTDRSLAVVLWPRTSAFLYLHENSQVCAVGPSGLLKLCMDMNRLWQLQDTVIIPSNVAMKSERGRHFYVFHGNLCNPLTYFPKHRENGEWSTQELVPREECVHPVAFQMEPCPLVCVVHDRRPIIRTDAQLSRDLFCFVFIFANPLMTTEGITKLMPYACEISLTAFIVMEDDNGYQSRRNMLEKK